MNVALISYPYLFDFSPNSWRWVAVAEHWAEQGHHVDVVCASKPGLPSYEVANGVRVHRVGGKAIELKETLSSLGKLGASLGGSKESAGASRGLARVVRSSLPLLKRVYQNTWRKVYWPDHACLWYFPTLRKPSSFLQKADTMA